MNYSTQDIEGITNRPDAVHASPIRTGDRRSEAAPERFDTVLVDEQELAEETGMNGK